MSRGPQKDKIPSQNWRPVTPIAPPGEPQIPRHRWSKEKPPPVTCLPSAEALSRCQAVGEAGDGLVRRRALVSTARKSRERGLR